MSPIEPGAPQGFDDKLPEAVDVVIIGGGIIGISTAWFLARAGKSVLVCEKGRVAGEQSGRNWGWTRVTGRDPDEVPIALESLRLWQEFAAEIEEDLGFRNGGLFALTETEVEMAGLEEWMDVARAHDMDSYLVNGAKAKEIVPYAVGDWKGGIVTPGDSRAEPFLAVPAIARAAQKLGVKVAENCAVRTIETTNQSIASVVTERGRVRTSAVVCAAGAWCSLFLSNLGISLPQLAVKGSVFRTARVPDSILDGTAGIGDLFVRRRADGGLTIGSTEMSHFIGPSSVRYGLKFLPSLDSASDLKFVLGKDPTQRRLLDAKIQGDRPTVFEQHRVLNPAPSRSVLRSTEERLRKRIPEIGGIEIEQAWAGMIDATPDVVPVMDHIPSIDGLFLATGFSGHGFGIGPGAGKVMAQLVMGEKPPHDLSRFRFSRFSDGSKMRPGPAI